MTRTGRDQLDPRDHTLSSALLHRLGYPYHDSAVRPEFREFQTPRQ